MNEPALIPRPKGGPQLAVLPTAAASDAVDLSGQTPAQIIERAIAAAREMLDMDMAYVADMRGGLHDYKAVAGDNESFGARAGDAIPLEGTYCEALLDGRLGNIVRDSQADPIVCDLAITERGRIGAYIGVPVVFSGGEIYGTFCCLSHTAEPSLRERDVKFMGVLARLIGDQLESQELDVEERRRALADGTVQALLAALEARDGYTEAHSSAVVELSLEVGRELGLDEDARADLSHAATLHDIGKIGVSDAVLRKPGPLDEAELREMRRHPEIGEQVVASMPPLAHLAPVIRAEHERWDGGGYPDGLLGEEIPLASRIVFVCDAFHAMTSDRPYRQALPLAVACEELVTNAGSQFCPKTVAAALAVIDAGRRLV